jgi:hypothetical protein
VVEDDARALRLERPIVEVPGWLWAVAADAMALAPGLEHLVLRHPELDAAERLAGDEDAGAGRRERGRSRNEGDAERRG